MVRRSFLELPLLVRSWKTPPREYLTELASMMRAAPVPGAAIGALRHGALAWIAHLGVRSAVSGEPVTPSTIFQAASLTKQVAAYLAFALRDQGKLDFDRPLAFYVDDLPNRAARAVTAKHVLSHSSGFPNWRYADEAKPVPDLVPAFEPGSKFQYSGEGYFYLQRVMEHVTGRPIGELANEVVFRPLGMASSSLVWQPLFLERTAQPHNSRGQLRKDWDKRFRDLHAYAMGLGKAASDLRYEEYSRLPGARLPDSMRPNAAASLVTTSEDYAKFVAASMRNAEFAKQQVTINEFLGWGLGWGIERTAGRTYMWQWGDNPGYKNFVIAEPATGDALFVFTNGDAGMRVYDRVVTHATGHDHPALFWL